MRSIQLSLRMSGVFELSPYLRLIKQILKFSRSFYNKSVHNNKQICIFNLKTFVKIANLLKDGNYLFKFDSARKSQNSSIFQSACSMLSKIVHIPYPQSVFQAGPVLQLRRFTAC